MSMSSLVFTENAANCKLYTFGWLNCCSDIISPWETTPRAERSVTIDIMSPVRTMDQMKESKTAIILVASVFLLICVHLRRFWLFWLKIRGECSWRECWYKLGSAEVSSLLLKGMAGCNLFGHNWCQALWHQLIFYSYLSNLSFNTAAGAPRLHKHADHKITKMRWSRPNKLALFCHHLHLQLDAQKVRLVSQTQ